MEIRVRARDIGWSDELRLQVERSIEFAVGRHRSRVETVSVYLADVNGLRDGPDDKVCQITAGVRGSRPVLILERGADILLVVSRAARRLGCVASPMRCSAGRQSAGSSDPRNHKRGPLD